jgi:hypothetical protein
MSHPIHFTFFGGIGLKWVDLVQRVRKSLSCVFTTLLFSMYDVILKIQRTHPRTVRVCSIKTSMTRLSVSRAGAANLLGRFPTILQKQKLTALAVFFENLSGTGRALGTHFWGMGLFETFPENTRQRVQL